MSLRVRELRLIGPERHYGVGFVDDGAVRPLSVIAGEISTGKTSVLEFIDFCLGARNHPRHIEVQRHVHAAQLEVEIDGVVMVLERPTFSSDQTVTVHRCALAELSEPHTRERRPLAPVGDPNSLSSLLLSAAGMEGMQLREAPTQEQSGTDPLSFRDLMPLSFITNQRLDNKNLLFENHHMRSLKLRQVIEIVFDIYDDQLTLMADQLDRLVQERRDLQAEIAALDTFLRENKVPDGLELDARIRTLEAEMDATESELGELSERMQAATSYAAAARAEYAELRRASGKAAAHLRDRETLLMRLLPLRGQYAEDERKLIFLEETAVLFDPLRVHVCPACAQEIPEPVEVQPGGDCSLCSQPVIAPSEPVDIGAERLAVKARLRAIEAYIDDVGDQIADARARYAVAQDSEGAAQSQLDSHVASDLSPFLAQRDELVRRQEDLRGQHVRAAESRQWLDGVSRRSADEAKLEDHIAQLKTRITSLKQSRPDRASVTSDLSERFVGLLRAFGFPKLEQPSAPFLDSSFVPYVRGNRYTEIGSSGALTLISLAWQLTIFERALEQGHRHPGLLLIDSPQKNLMPEDGQPGDDFADPAIPGRVWRHIVGWTNSMGAGCQVIIVDNKPPAFVDDHVVVRYSGRRSEPPYGLIEDEFE